MTTPAAASDASPAPIGSSRRALSSAVVYALGYAVQRAIGFLLLPLYTRAISPADYGALSALFSVATAVGILFTFGLDLAIFRTYFQLEDQPVRQREFVDSVWRFLVVVPLAGALLLSSAVWPFLPHNGRVHGTDVLLALVGVALSAAATTLPLSILRAEQRLRDYLRLTAVTAAGAPLFTVGMVVLLHGGLRGWLLASALANGVSLLAAGLVVPWRRRSSFDGKLVRRAVLFSLPMLPHVLSHWALQLADRTVLAGLVSASALGVYSLASNLALPVMVALQSLNQGFMPMYAKTGFNQAHAHQLQRVVVLQITLVVAGCLGGALMGSQLVNLMAPGSYSGAGSLVAWIVLGYGFLGLYYIPMNGATLGAGRNRFAWLASATSAVTNIGLLFLLVPKYGLHAAAVASAIGYLVLLITIAVYAHARPNPVSYQWRRIVPTITVAGCIYGAALETTPPSPWPALAVRALWFAVFPLAMVLLKIIPLRAVRSHLTLRSS